MTPSLDEVPVRDNPAYQRVNLQKSYHENTSSNECVPTQQVSPQYGNLVEVDEECGGDDNKHVRECKND